MPHILVRPPATRCRRAPASGGGRLAGLRGRGEVLPGLGCARHPAGWRVGVAEVSLGAKPTAVWRIKDSEGQLQALHARFDRDGAKECRWRLPGAKRWGLDGRKVSTLPLYGSERVQEWSKDDTTIILTEGEKAADALLQAGFCALGTVTGAGSTPGPEALGVLEGFEMVLWPDNDDQGRAHMERVARVLQGV